MKWVGAIVAGGVLGAGIVIALHHFGIGRKLLGF